MYPLCKDCFVLRDKKEVLKCENCNAWFLAKNGCECNAPQKTDENLCKTCGKPHKGKFDQCYDCYLKANKAPEAESCTPTKTDENLCDTCGKSHKGKYKQCYDCYLKVKKPAEGEYTKKAIVKNLDPEVKDVRKQWEAMNRCNDGHYVRSYSEVLIDNWLYENGQVHAYEKKVFLKKNPNETLLCDFYIPDGKIHIEFFGLDNEQYKTRKAEKIKLYNDNGLNLIVLEQEHIKILDDVMPRKLHEFQD